MPDELFKRIATIVEAARGHVARSVNTAMVHAYWHIGREIVEHEQGGQDRAEYGERLMERLAERLTRQFGRGFGVATLRRVRGFYLLYPGGSAIPAELGGPEKRSTALIESGDAAIRSTGLIESAPAPASLFPPVLSWSHYLVLTRVRDTNARAFYEIEAARESWSVRQLERQVASLLFERLAVNKSQDEILALARRGQEVALPGDVIKDPFVLEFLDAGAIDGMRMSHFSLKRLETETRKRRIAHLVARSGTTVRLDEIQAVLAGAVLPPRKRIVMTRIRQAAVLCEAARYYSQRGDRTTPETCATYVDFALHGQDHAATLWSQFVGRPRERLLEIHRGSIPVPEPMRHLYEWMDADDLVSDNGLLRAAVLHWGLSILFSHDHERPAIDAVLDHELRASRLDPHGLLVLAENPRGEEALSLRRAIVRKAEEDGDLTEAIEHFAHHVGLALSDLRQQLERCRLETGGWRPEERQKRTTFSLRSCNPRASAILRKGSSTQVRLTLASN